MKTCQTAQKVFQLVGIRANRASFGLYELMHILSYILWIMSSFLYLINEAEMTKQFAQPIFLILINCLMLITYLSFKFNSRKVFKIFDEVEQIVIESE